MKMQQLVTQNDKPTAIAELDVQISTANKYPRDTQLALEEAAAMVTSSKQVAESCSYSVPRKDQNGKTKYITGGSIRLAEIFCQCWGNLHAATRILPNNDGKTIVAEAVAWDLQKNIKMVAECRRSIYSAKSKRAYSHDMQIVTANAAASIALRNAIFRVIPKAYADRLHEIAVKFATSKDNLPDFIDRVFNYFINAGYSEQHILQFIDKKSKNDIVRDDVVILCGIKNRIDDGQVAANESLPLKNADFVEKSTNLAAEFLGDTPQSIETTNSQDNADFIAAYDEAEQY